MGCGKCDFYSRGFGRCRLGRVNPRTKKDTITAMKFYGPTGICLKNKWRTKALEELRKIAEKINEVPQ